MTNNTPELKECPFCGSSDNLTIDFVYKEDWCVECDNCHVGQHALWPSKEHAIQKWNTRANKPAEVDLDGLKRMSVGWYLGKFDSSDIIGMPSDREVIFGLLDYLHASGHLATGKGGGEPYRLSIEEQGVMRNALRKSVTVIEQQQPAAPTQIDAGELEKAIADLQSRLNISSDITIKEGMPLKVNGLSQLSAQRLLQAARAQLAKSKGGV